MLNIHTPSDSSQQENSGIIPIKYNKKTIIQDVIEDIRPIIDIELNDLVEEIIVKHSNLNSVVSKTYILFFDDGTFEILPESRRINLYEEDNETDEIEKSLKTVSELKKDDQIILPKRDIQLKELLELALKKDEYFSRSIEVDAKWRMLMSKHIKRCGMDLSFFRKKLKDNGFSIVSDQTIQNWIDTDTRRPDNFVRLLKALANIGIINISEISLYEQHNSELKSIQITFVRTAISKLLLRLHGIDVVTDEKFTDELLNDFIDHIDIKRISSIYKV